MVFGETIRKTWLGQLLSTCSAHSYDNAGNREKSYDVRPGASWDDREWWYEYDGLDRLVEARVGVTPEVRNSNWFPDPGSEAYDYDMIDNLGEHEVDWSGDGFYDDLDELKDAAFNANNEQTGQEWEADPTDPNVSTPPTDDNQSLATGALYIYAQPEKTGETLPDITYTRDAWGRLVQVKYDTNVRAEYEYNGLGHRTLAEVDTDTVPDGTVDELRLFFYDPQWRLLEERINDDSDAGSTIDRHAQQVWGFRYIDDAVMRREDGTANGSYANSSDSEWHYATDALFSVIAVLDDTAGLQERVEYTPYGTALHHWYGDFDGDRDIDSGDSSALSNASGNSIDDPGYKVEIDLNRDGTIDLNDTPAAPPGGGSALPRGWASDPDSVDSMLARSSMLLDRRVDLQLARHRYYSAELGRWIRTDPALATTNRFVVFHSNPTTLYRVTDTLASAAALTHGNVAGDQGNQADDCGSSSGPSSSGEGCNEKDCGAVGEYKRHREKHGPQKALSWSYCSDKAYGWSERMTSNPDHQNALRHCFWACCLAGTVGEEAAEDMLDHHEICGDRCGQSTLDRAIDECNNKAGVGIGLAYDPSLRDQGIWIVNWCQMQCLPNFVNGKLCTKQNTTPPPVNPSP